LRAHTCVLSRAYVLTSMPADYTPKILVAGGGVAGLEVVLALQSCAPGWFDIELLAPERHFVDRPLAVGTPFQPTPPLRVELSAIAHDRGFSLTRDALDGIDAASHEAVTQGGDRVPYDVLVLALGTRPVAVVDGALPFRGRQDVAAVEDALMTIGSGPARVAYVARSASTWTLPLYELALQTVAWAAGRDLVADVLLATAELEPLEAFGSRASRRVADLMRASGVCFIPGADVDRVQDGFLRIGPEGSLRVDLAIALPSLLGPAVPGVPHDIGGFTPVDERGRVHGLPDVYAVGDMTSRPIKQGGLAAHQADVAASAIAASAGAPVGVQPYRPVLRAMLFGGRAPLYLRNPPLEDEMVAPDTYLARYLATHDELETVQ
jgi:sulfide:quinone oxidoreductase